MNKKIPTDGKDTNSLNCEILQHTFKKAEVRLFDGMLAKM